MFSEKITGAVRWLSSKCCCDVINGVIIIKIVLFDIFHTVDYESEVKIAISCILKKFKMAVFLTCIRDFSFKLKLKFDWNTSKALRINYLPVFVSLQYLKNWLSYVRLCHTVTSCNDAYREPFSKWRCDVINDVIDVKMTSFY